MMSKTRTVTKTCRCAKLTDMLNTWRERFIMIIIMLCYFEIFISFQGLMRTFSKHYSKCKTVSIKFRKTLQERRLQILSFTNILTYEKYFHNFTIFKGYSWNIFETDIRGMFLEYYFMIAGTCQKINICYWQIIHVSTKTAFPSRTF